MSLRFISLFAGIGAFDVGFERANMQCVGQVEIDRHCRTVLERHWPDVPRHDDITTAHGMIFGPAEVITFGSPCQGLSHAGKRKGLADDRSGLFTEAVRFIREMKEATDDQYPRLAVWENVPGAYSSAAGADFAAVLEGMVGGTVSVPGTGWRNAGVAFGPGGQAAWRTLDSQHFGVAQRRRRIFLVTDFGGECAGQILFEPTSLRRNTEARREEGESVALALHNAHWKRCWTRKRNPNHRALLVPRH